MALHIKYRPNGFDNFYGNIPTVNSLRQSVLSVDRLHTYLFYGPPGCGKTTLARIFAKEIGCDENDIIEMNMSDNRGIDSARDIINKMYFKPLYGKTKVYILDEVHKTTKEFQNAILKALEEPPKHVYFLLCTTDPDMLIKTVRSRCAPYSVSKLPDKRIKKLLENICQKEKITFDEEVIKTIISAADGSPRQSLIILEQVKDLNKKAAIKAINKYSESEIQSGIDLCRALLTKKKWPVIAKILKGINIEPEKIRKATLGYMTSVLLNEDNIQAAIIIENFEDNFYDSGKAGLVMACYRSIK